MTERERLIELIEQCSCHYSPPCTGECGECHNVEMYDRNIEHIADHLLANGVIVPPCKVGSTIYMLVTKRPRVYCEPYTMIQKSKVTFGNLERVIRDFGKTVFLTREEAENALEERGTPKC